VRRLQKQKQKGSTAKAPKKTIAGIGGGETLKWAFGKSKKVASALSKSCQCEKRQFVERDRPKRLERGENNRQAGAEEL